MVTTRYGYGYIGSVSTCRIGSTRRGNLSFSLASPHKCTRQSFQCHSWELQKHFVSTMHYRNKITMRTKKPIHGVLFRDVTNQKCHTRGILSKVSCQRCHLTRLPQTCHIRGITPEVYIRHLTPEVSIRGLKSEASGQEARQDKVQCRQAACEQSKQRSHWLKKRG